jgi:hypothetical protein
MKAQRGSKRYSSTLSVTAVGGSGVGGYRHALAALPRGKTPGTHCTGSRMGFGASFDKEGISCLHQGSSSLHQVTIPTALCSPVSMACKPAHTYAFTCKCCCILILIPKAGLLRAFMILGFFQGKY